MQSGTKRETEPFVAIGHKLYLNDKGEAQCVDLIFRTLGAPRPSDWKPGRPVTRGADIPVGTAIATFVEGKYPNDDSGQHAAIYLGQNAEGIKVIEQYKNITPRNVAVRTIRWDNTTGLLSNRGGAYSTILWKDK